METFADTSPFHAGVKEKNTKTNQITIAKNQKCIFTLVTYKTFPFMENMLKYDFMTYRHRLLYYRVAPIYVRYKKRKQSLQI